MSTLRLLLLPFAWLYGLALMARHAMYDARLFKSTSPALPAVVVGNLSLGGTGKTPMLELVLRTLNGTAPLATLSRGYGRKGTSIHEVQPADNAERSGDEPLQVKKKFNEVRVFVGADRVRAIERIQQLVPQVKAVILDDAFQHRRLNAGLNILLTTFQRPWYNDHLIPAGRLRDVPARARAAQVVVVTKCPALPSAEERREWRQRLGLNADQELFFSGITYEDPKLSVGSGQGTVVEPLPTANRQLPTSSYLLFTGIADPSPLVEHLQAKCTQLEHMAFPDHHLFTTTDLRALAQRYATFAAGPKTLITTEKDAMRLRSVIAGSPLEGLPLAVIGMRTVILNEPERFATLIRDHVATYPAHR